MTREGLGAGQHQHGEHKTRRDTERISYDRLRSAGQSRSQSREGARKVAREVHDRK